jgi:hypothetical protein
MLRVPAAKTYCPLVQERCEEGDDIAHHPKPSAQSPEPLRSGIDPEIHGEAGHLHHRGDFELLKDVGAVKLDRSFGDLKIGRDLLVQLSAQEVQEDFALARAQPVISSAQDLFVRARGA